MAVKIGSLLIKLGLDSGEFKSGLGVTERELKKSIKRIQGIGEQMQGIGVKLSAAVSAPIIALGVSSVKAAIESKEAIGQVEAALKSMGGAAGWTSEQLQQLASDQMRQSLYDDDEILRSVSANLLTFGSIAGDQFAKAQQAAIDLSARLGQDLQSSAIMVGKALNDPAKGLAALRKVGIQFTEQQQEQIKAMAEAGNAAGAQRIMLAELERQFGGSAQAMRDANPGAAMKQAWDDMQETIGSKLLPILPRITEAITKVLDVFGKLPEGAQTAVIVIAGLAAALGPVMIGLGSLVSAAAPFIAVIGSIGASGGVVAAASAAVTGLAAAFGPILAPMAAVAAAGYLIYQNWDKIAPVLQELWKHVQETLGPPLKQLVDELIPLLQQLWDGPFGQAIRTAMDLFLKLQGVLLKVFGSAVIEGIKVAVNLIGDALGLMASHAELVASIFDGSLGKKAVKAVKDLYNAVTQYVLDGLNRVWDQVKAKLDAVGGWFFDLYDAVVGHSYIPDMVDGIAAEMARLDGVMVDPAEGATKTTAEKFREMEAEIQQILNRLRPDVADFLNFQRERGVLGNIKDRDRREAAQRALALEYDEAANDNRKEPSWMQDVTPIVPAMDEVQDRLEEMAGQAQENTTRVSKSFREMAQDTLSSLQGLAESIKSGGFLDILGSVVDVFMQLASTGVFGSGLQTKVNATVPGYAGGTDFHPGGMAVVGERGPELLNLPRGSQVIPNHKLGGGGNTYVIKGNLMTEEFWAQIRAGDIAAANSGAEGGVRRMAHMQSRML